MTDWRELLSDELALVIEVVNDVHLPDLPEADRRRLAEAQGLLGEGVAALQKAKEAGDHDAEARALGTIAVLREVIQQTSHLDEIITAQAMRSVARQVAERSLQLALEAGAKALLGEEFA